MNQLLKPLFHEIESANDSNASLSALESLAAHFASTQQFHRLFEVRKFQSRIRAGLPPFYLQRPPEMTESQAAAIERDLLTACRETGNQLASLGRLAQAWTYLQPIDDQPFVKRIVESTPISDENLTEVIHIGLYEKAHPSYAYGLVLGKLGTCQAISTYDAIEPSLEVAQRADLAAMLVEHVTTELQRNLVASLQRQAAISNDTNFGNQTLKDLIAKHETLIKQTSPHLDATHLVSTMRIARTLKRLDSIEAALILARYGQLLPEMLQYDSDPPFQKTYLDHEHFFSGLLGYETDQAVDHFRSKITSADQPSERAYALETLVDYLVRLGRIDEAIQLTVNLAGDDFGSAGIAPGLIEMSLQADDPNPIWEHFQRHDDLLSYAAGILTWRLARKSGQS